MALFGMKPQGVEALLAQAQPTQQPVDPARLAAISQPRKKGLFGGNAFRADSPLWHIMGGVGDVLTGEQVYTQGLMQQREKQRKSLMEQAQAEAEDAQWYEREKWKRANPEPRTNDTIEDFNWYKNLPEADRQMYHKMRPVYRQGPDWQFYPVEPQASAVLGTELPEGWQIEGGPAQAAPGGFPR